MTHAATKGRAAGRMGWLGRAAMALLAATSVLLPVGCRVANEPYPQDDIAGNVFYT